MNILITGVAGFIGSFTARELLRQGHNVIGVDNFDPFYDRRAKEFNLDLIRLEAGEGSENFSEDVVKGIYEKLNLFSGGGDAGDGRDVALQRLSGDGEVQGEDVAVQRLYGCDGGDENKFNFYEQDITEFEGLEKIFGKHEIDGIIHLAAMAGVPYSIKDPIKYTKVNDEGTVNLLELSVRNKMDNFVFASSSSVYGHRTEVPFTEDLDVNTPISPYAATKRMGEIMNFTYNHIYNINITNLRFFTVYGPLQRPYGMAIQKFIKQVERGEPMTLYGDGEMARDYTYIDDIVSGIIGALENNVGFNTYNLGNENPVSLNKLSTEIQTQMGRGEVVNLECPATEVPITYSDISKARKFLNYDPKTSIEEGIKRQIELFNIMPKWYREL